MDLYELSREVKTCALALAAVLKGRATDEATQRIAEGFLVPAPGVLTHAAGVFAGVLELRGDAQSYQQLDSEDQRIDLICALASALDGAEHNIDLSWSNHWSTALHQHRHLLAKARDVLGQWRAGQHELLRTSMKQAVDAHYGPEVYNR